MDKRYLRKILMIVAVMLIVATMIVSVVNLYFKSPETEVITRFLDVETIEVSYECPAIVSRNEYVIECDVTDKSVLYFYDNGEKVAKNSVLAYVYDDPKYQSVIETVYEKKQLVTHYEDVIFAYNMYTLTELNAEISKLTNQINSFFASNDTTELQKLEKKLSLFIGVRDIKIGSSMTVSTCYQTIDNLNVEIDELIDSMGNEYQIVKSSRSGYFFRGSDGLEATVTPSALDSITCSEVVELFDTESVSGNNVGKIVEGYDWYSVCVIPATMIPEFNVGSEYKIAITNESNLSVNMTLSKIIYTYGEENAALVFYSESAPDSFEYSRFQYFDVVYASYSGYAVPTMAVRYVNGVQGVYVLYGYRVEFREISPLYERDGIVLADPDAKSKSEYKILSYYDNVILKGYDLYVDKIID